MKPYLIFLRALSRSFLALPLALALPLSGQGVQNPPVKQDDPTTYKSVSVLRATTRLVVVDVVSVEGKWRLLHDFTTDTKALRDVLANFKPQGPTHIATVDAAASPFGRSGSFQPTGLGRNATCNAMSFLAKALGGYHGRKNLIWLSEGFPINLFPDATIGAGTMAIEDYAAVSEQIADDLMNAQVALYPIDASGVSINDRFSTRTAMISMSERTGRKTFYNRNGLDMGLR